MISTRLCPLFIISLLSMKSNKLTNHKLKCPYCKERHKLKIIRQIQEYKKVNRFSGACAKCDKNLIVYMSVDGFFSLHKTRESRFHNPTYKVKRTTKPFVRDVNKPVYTDLCYDLIQKRLSLNMTQYGAAAHLGVSQPTYHNWESGKTVPRAKLLNKILEFLYL